MGSPPADVEWARNHARPAHCGPCSSASEIIQKLRVKESEAKAQAEYEERCNEVQIVDRYPALYTHYGLSYTAIV